MALLKNRAKKSYATIERSKCKILSFKPGLCKNLIFSFCFERPPQKQDPWCFDRLVFAPRVLLWERKIQNHQKQNISIQTKKIDTAKFGINFLEKSYRKFRAVGKIFRFSMIKRCIQLKNGARTGFTFLIQP